MKKRKLSYKIAKFLSPILRPLLRISSPFLRIAKKFYNYYKKLLPDNFYNSWAMTNRDVCYVEKEIRYKPLISVVVPVFNPSSTHLIEMVYSVVNQHYDNWELVLVNTSNNISVRSQAEKCANIDDRIKVVDLEKNQGISNNTNIAI